MTLEERYKAMFSRMSDEQKLQVMMDYHAVVEAMLRKHFHSVKHLDVYSHVFERVRQLHGYADDAIY